MFLFLSLLYSPSIPPLSHPFFFPLTFPSCLSISRFACVDRENILVLDIFFEALNYETIEQKKAYEVAGLLGKLGSRAMNKREITSDSESRGREGNVDKCGSQGERVCVI